MADTSAARRSPARSRFAAPRRLGEVVAEDLVRALASSEYEPGDRLPPEIEMQEDFGVSRTAVREALKWVESRGLIVIRQGRGAVARPIEHWDLTDPAVLSALLEHNPAMGTFQQLMAIRSWIEPELARAAAQLMPESELDILRTLLAQMSQEVANPDAFVDHDGEFHEVIARNGGNQVSHSILASFVQPLRISRMLMNAYPNAARQAHEEHSTILAALEARDSDAAAIAMRTHLDAGLRRGERIHNEG